MYKIPLSMCNVVFKYISFLNILLTKHWQMVTYEQSFFGCEWFLGGFLWEVSWIFKDPPLKHAVAIGTSVWRRWSMLMYWKCFKRWDPSLVCNLELKSLFQYRVPCHWACCSDGSCVVSEKSHGTEMHRMAVPIYVHESAWGTSLNLKWLLTSYT